jgi:hypothetical protein
MPRSIRTLASPGFLLLAFFPLVLVAPAAAQDDSTVGADAMGVSIVDKGDDAADVKQIGVWYTTGSFTLNLLQSAYSNNWNGGDKGSLTWGATFKAVAERQMSEKWNWFNRVKLDFAQIHQQERSDETGDLYWKKPEKTSDEIDLESLLRYTTGSGWDPYGSLRFQSQFQDVNDPYGRSIALNPLDFRVGLGVARTFIDEEKRFFLIRVGFALREISRKFYLAAPDSSNETDRTNNNDGGLELRLDYRMPLLSDRVDFVSRLTAYQPIYYSGKDAFDSLTAEQRVAAGLDPDVGDFPLVVDVDWQNTFVTRITKVINVNLEIRWIYDKYDNSVSPEFDPDGELVNGDAVRQAVRKAGQYKQVLSLGVGYAF